MSRSQIALMIDSLTSTRIKRLIQSVVYLPHFISWVIIVSLFQQFLGGTGVVLPVGRLAHLLEMLVLVGFGLAVKFGKSCRRGGQGLFVSAHFAALIAGLLVGGQKLLVRLMISLAQRRHTRAQLGQALAHAAQFRLQIHRQAAFVPEGRLVGLDLLANAR